MPGELASIVDRLRWDLPKLVVVASFTPDAIHMRLRNPKAQQDDDDWDAHLIDSAYRGADRLSAAEQELESWWRETWGRRVDLRSRGKALGLLLAADFGSWSESHVVYAMSKVTHSMNWPAPEQDAVSFFADNGDSQLVALRSDEDGDKFGFGEYQLIELTFSIDETDRDAVFVTALDECVQLLGVPDLVGGPEAQAIWRRGATITTLGRGLRPATMWLRIEPMAPRDAAARAAREYGCSWLAWPDESSRRDVGIFGEKEPVIADFARFETGMDRLFDSLTWDLPLLHPYATYVIWQLTSAEHTDWIAQGWFCAYAQHRVEIYEGGDVRTHMYPHGPTVGRDIAAITKAAVRAQDITDPGRELRFRAWMSLQPQGLQAFRLGLEWDEREVHDR
ncbi:hypothetical protein [Nocardia sp. NPDC004123]